MEGIVYRAPKRDKNGDPTDDDGNVIRGLPEVGTIHGIIMGGQSVTPNWSRQESADTTGLIGCPTSEPVKLRHGDRVVINGLKYSVVGQPQWDYPHDLTGTDFGYYWCRVEATVN
jgi:hypothetical protein